MSLVDGIRHRALIGRAAIAAIVILLILVTCSPAADDEPARYDVVATDLSDDELEELAQTVLMERQQALKNVFIDLEVRESVRGANGAETDVGRFDFRHWQLGGSYRLDTQSFPNHSTERPNTVSQSGYDARSGTTMMLAKGGNKDDQLYGRIDNQHDPITTVFAYQAFLLEHPRRTSLAIVPYLLSCKDEWKFRRNGEIVEIRCPHRYLIGGEPSKLGHYRCDLDMTKGFMPVRVEEIQGDVDRKTGIWRRIVTAVSASRLVNGVWFPAEFQRIAESEGYKPGQAGVTRVKVSRIELGTVTDKDVRLEFPPGTVVVDAIKGVYFTVGASGTRLGEEPVVSRALAVTVQNGNMGLARILGIVLTAALAILLSVLVVSKRLRARAAG